MTVSKYRHSGICTCDACLQNDREVGANNLLIRAETSEAHVRELHEQVRVLREALTVLKREVEDLAEESGGVYGYHNNGDPATWEELLPGGRYEYLQGLDLAVEVLRSTEPKGKPFDL